MLYLCIKRGGGGHFTLDYYIAPLKIQLNFRLLDTTPSYYEILILKQVLSKVLKFKKIYSFKCS